MTNLAKVCYNSIMKTINISITSEQAKQVDKSVKELGFANRSEFIRATFRYIYKTNPALQKIIASSPFTTAEVSEKKLPTLEEIKKKAIPILKKNDVEFAGIFGSYARGEAKSESDLDLLVKLKDEAKMSLLDVIGIENELSDLLGIKVQLVTVDAVHPYIKDSVAKDLIVLYGQRPKLH